MTATPSFPMSRDEFVKAIADYCNERVAAECGPLIAALTDAAILFHRHTHDPDWGACNSPDCKRFRAIIYEEVAR